MLHYTVIDYVAFIWKIENNNSMNAESDAEGERNFQKFQIARGIARNDRTVCRFTLQFSLNFFLKLT